METKKEFAKKKVRGHIIWGKTSHITLVSLPSSQPLMEERIVKSL